MKSPSSNPDVPSSRRLSLAISVAAASTTFAIGITAASLFGWFSPAAALAPELAPTSRPPLPAAPVPAPVLLVPIAPAGPSPSSDPPLQAEPSARERAQLALWQEAEPAREHHQEEDDEDDHDEDDDDEGDHDD